MRKIPKKAKPKNCPFIDGNCLKKGCEIYSEMLNRCEISLVAYNLYLLTTVMQENLEDDTEEEE